MSDKTGNEPAELDIKVKVNNLVKAISEFNYSATVVGYSSFRYAKSEERFVEFIMDVIKILKK